MDFGEIQVELNDERGTVAVKDLQANLYYKEIKFLCMIFIKLIQKYLFLTILKRPSRYKIPFTVNQFLKLFFSFYLKMSVQDDNSKFEKV